MSDPSRITRATYDEVALDFLEHTRDRSRGAARLDRFAAHMPQGASVLDLGCGPGCDGALLRAHGLRVVGLDLSLGMLRAGIAEFPFPRVQADLRALPFACASVAGVWANACLLHLSPEDALRALREIKRVVPPGALVHLSVKEGQDSGWETARYGRPRWFHFWSADALDAVIADAGLTLLEAASERGHRDDWLIRLASFGATANDGASGAGARTTRT